MSYKVQKLLEKVARFEKLAQESLTSEAKKKEKKKLDPKAKVRNRGTVVFPAASSKDKKDHFPINNEAQARNALARANQYSSVPEWYSGSLQSLVSAVARKVHSKYPGIEVSEKSKKPGKDGKKKKSSLESELFSFSQDIMTRYGQAEPKVPAGTPGSPEYASNWGQGNDDTIDLDTDEEGNQIRQPVSFQRNRPAPRFKPVPPEVQEALAKLGYKGSKGESLVRPNGKGDGQLGPITEYALGQYRTQNKDRAVDIHGNPISQELMYEMIKRDASGENKTKEQMFDAKTTNDALNAAQAYATQLEASLRGGQISAKNAAQTKQALSQYLQTLQQHVTGIYSTLQDNRSSQQERDSATQMRQKYDGLRTTFERWVNYLDMLAKQAPTPMTDEKPYG